VAVFFFIYRIVQESCWLSVDLMFSFLLWPIAHNGTQQLQYLYFLISVLLQTASWWALLTS